MKNQLLATALSVSALVAMGQNEKNVDSKITDVTVFLNKAQVTREVKTRIEPGRVNLVVRGLTSQLDPESIQVTGKGSFIILGISHQQNYLSELNMPKSLTKDRRKYTKFDSCRAKSNGRFLQKSIGGYCYFANEAR